MAVEAPLVIAFIGVIIATAVLFTVTFVNTQEALGWASAIRTYNPPIINGTVYCPGGSFINPYLNATGLYKCGPCLAYIHPNATLTLTCPR